MPVNNNIKINLKLSMFEFIESKFRLIKNCKLNNERIIIRCKSVRLLVKRYP